MASRMWRLSLAVRVVVACALAAWLTVGTDARQKPRMPAGQGQASRFCDVEEGPNVLGPGSWDGTFHLSNEASGRLMDSQVSYFWNADGTLRIDVNDEGRIGTIDGTVKWSPGARIAGAATGTSMYVAEGKLSGPQPPEREKADMFVVNAPLHIAGDIHIAVESGAGNASKGGRGDITLRFTVSQATCESAKGSLFWKDFDRVVKPLEDQGFALTLGKAEWTATNTDAGKEVAELKKQLADAGKGGSDYSRDSERAALGAIGNQVKEKPRAIRPCLESVYRDHMRNKMIAWSNQDVRTLRNYTGDVKRFNWIAQGALETARSAAILGIDRCTVDPQVAIFDTYAYTANRLALAMIAGNMPTDDIMKQLKSVALVGDVSPAKQQETKAALKAMLLKEWRDAMKKLASGASAHNKDATCAPSVAAAWGTAIRAEQTLVQSTEDVPPAESVLKHQPPRCTYDDIMKVPKIE